MGQALRQQVLNLLLLARGKLKHGQHLWLAIGLAAPGRVAQNRG
jgi:hypothetical protein